MTFRLYLLQRVTAALMAPMVIGHLVMIFLATRDGLSAAEILARTRGSVWWGLFYGAFVLAAAAHGAIGIRNVLAEWGPPRVSRSPRLLDGLMRAFGVALALLGLRAVYAVIIAG